VYHLYSQQSFSFEDNLEELIFQHYEFCRHLCADSFDTTRVKRISEKKLLPQDFKIKFIMPLVTVDGLLYATDERVYMQPLHPQILGKAVLNIKLKNVKQMFKRRYTLMDLGLEIISESENLDAKGKPKKKTMYLIFKSTFERNVVWDILIK